MKQIIILFLLVPSLVFSQVSSWRSSSSSTSTSSSSSSKTSSSPSVESSVSTWRNSSQNEYSRPQVNRGSNIIVHDPWFGGYNRWNAWGAPAFGWNSWSPMYYWNDWGYRQPARVYVFSDGRRDTIRGKKPIISFGLHHTSNAQMGAFFVIGNKGYFVFDFNSTYERDRSTYFPNGRIDRVDFPMIKDLVKQRSFYFGAGKRIKRTGCHGMVGFANERILFRGRDAVGEITFPKSSDNFVTFKFGAIRDFKNISLKMDYDPVIGYGQMGLGVNF